MTDQERGQTSPSTGIKDRMDGPFLKPRVALSRVVVAIEHTDMVAAFELHQRMKSEKHTGSPTDPRGNHATLKRSPAELPVSCKAVDLTSSDRKIEKTVPCCSGPVRLLT